VRLVIDGATRGGGVGGVGGGGGGVNTTVVYLVHGRLSSQLIIIFEIDKAHLRNMLILLSGLHRSN